ncbi:hypothetical protein SELMODRAFT_440658 [Selaginella moellendorffii]|uniref:Syndetin C-terminal domain-containing protein n=1 Tax=Selaginella moellendorffii TaxID=88036 RepID=D8RDB2_SELML|nr:hypothetical protein SELMODRAFT_440658 [Selaginella moellendorffii]
MDFKNIGEKFLQSVKAGRARSFILSSSSDRPEIPARAAAAAAIAKSIAATPPHDRLSIASTSGETPSDFDPVRYLLEHLPEQPTQEFFENKVSQRMLQLDDITEKLSIQVMEHHEEMVKGMQMVTEVEKDLQVSKIICKNGRRRLSLAMHEVSQDLVVAGNVRKKQVLMDMLPILERIQHAIDIKSRLDSTIEEGNYGKALQMCSECLQLLEEMSGLAAVQDMNHSIEEWLQKTIVKVDEVLLDVCRQFNVEKYMTVIDAYAMIDDVPGLSDKTQTFYAQIIVARTHSVLKEYLPQVYLPTTLCMPYLMFLVQTDELQAAQRRGRLPYNDLCLRLPDTSYRPCLFKTLELLYDILCSYFRMMACDWKLQTSAVSNGALHRSRSQGSLSQPVQAAHRHSSSLESGTKDDSVSGRMQNGPALTENMLDSRNRLRMEVARAVGKGLEKGRKTVWELAARRVSALLSSDAFCAASAHHFLLNLDLLNKFILAGEAFSGAEAIPLRAKLVKQSEKYFGAFHRQNLEVLRMMLEKEPWQRVPSGFLKSLNLAGLTGNGAPIVASTTSESMMLKPGEKLEVQQGFTEWLRKGNPFTESRIADVSSGKVDGSPHGKMPSNVTPKEEEEENEDLLADFIDEDSQRPGRLETKSNAGDDERITLTSSSINMLRSIDRYARLMQILEPISLEVFKGLSQVFELYFFIVFKTFGQRDLFSGRAPSDSPVISGRLRGALVRISQQLEEQRLKYAAGHPQPMNAGVFEMSSQGFGAGMVSPSNFFAIKERTVAAESLIFLATLIRNSRQHLQSLLHQNALPFVDQFFARTVDASIDLREHVYKTGARLLLNIGSYFDRISNTRWELKELGMEHNGYVDSLLGEFKQYTVRLSNAGVSRQVHELLLQYGVDILAETLVEGLSRVRRCNNEGRAVMSLDLQVLINGLQHLAPAKLKANLQIVDAYIKAFYLPETEFLYWAKSHPEYSKQQIINLINLVASMNNWKRKTRTDLLERIESGDL